MGARERVDLQARVDDARDIGIRAHVDAVEAGAGALAGEADIGDRHLVAVAEGAGLRVIVAPLARP